MIPTLRKWLGDLDKKDESWVHQRLEALWMFQTHNVVEEKLLREILAPKDHRARAAATRALPFLLDRVQKPLKLLEKLVNDKHPRVRLEAVRALSFVEDESAAEIALGVLEHEIDDYIQYTLDETMRQLEP